MKTPLIGIAIGITQIPFLALAQQNSTASSLNEVVVEASKLDKDLFTMTQAATVIEQADIERGAYTSVTEILRTVPGIEFKQVGGPGQYTYLRMRGFGAGYVLVVVDGVTMNMGSSGDVGNLIGQIDPASIESIEILRGPQTVLYGANASAGVISITTKRGTLDPQRSVSVEVGSLGWKKAKASLQQVHDVGDGKLSTSLSLSKTDSDGVIRYEGLLDGAQVWSVALNVGRRPCNAGLRRQTQVQLHLMLA